MSGVFQDFGVLHLLEIGILAVIFYNLLIVFRGTRSAQMLSGLALFFLLLLVVAQLLNLEVLNWTLRQMSLYLALALIIIFQPEIRRALAELGNWQLSPSSPSTSHGSIEDLVRAVTLLSERKIGALIAVEREHSTAHLIGGTPINSAISPELLVSIFYPKSPLHDGGVIIRNMSIAEAGCVFPLTTSDKVPRGLGTRHRAALGLTEETDAVVVIVSEETGTVSTAFRGKLHRGLDEERLRRQLEKVLSKEQRRHLASLTTVALPTPQPLADLEAEKPQEEAL